MSNQIKILILGLGNRLRKDDGFGSCLAEALQKLGLNFVVDGDAYGVNIVDYLEDVDVVIFLDVVANLKPGEVQLFEICVDSISYEHVKIDTHRVDPLSITLLAKSLNIFNGKAYLIGVGPKDISFGFGLSQEVLNAIPKVCSILIELLKRFNLNVEIDVNKVIKLCEQCR